MHRAFRLFGGLLVAAFLVPAAALAGHLTDPRSPNLSPLGHIEEPALTGGAWPGGPPGGTNPNIHTDIAFQGNLAFQGNWDGFHIRDISNPAAPTTVSRTFCPGNQGDVLVYGNILVRSWDTGAGTPGVFGAGTTCDGQPVPAGTGANAFQGVHVFDISNLADPQVVAHVRTPQGSHTATAVPDPANNRLLVYSSASSTASPTIDIIAIPLSAPQNAALVRQVQAGGSCHDIGVFLGDVMMAACAGGSGFRAFSLGGPRGGSLTNPELLYSVTLPLVTTGHSASFSWNGDILIFGHEPGGGLQPSCEAIDDDRLMSFYFHRASDGALLGRWVLPRPQGANENCTLHNYNVVPFLDRHVMVHGSYQSGTSVVDFTNPAAAQELAWSDPPPYPTPPPGASRFCQTQDPPGCALVGAWSSHWYNGPIYETNIAEGLNIFQVNEPWWNSALRVERLNPQTQEESMVCTGVVSSRGALRAGRRTTLTTRLQVWDQAVQGLRVRFSGGGVSRVAVTNSRGVAQIAVTPRRPGTMRVTVASTLNMEGCAAALRIAPPRRAGTAAGGGGGAGLTGRIS